MARRSGGWKASSDAGGNVPVVSALSTLAYEGRRAEFFEGQLVAALKILQAGDVQPGAMTGSWAGAMGHTQFTRPANLAYAVDFTGGRAAGYLGRGPDGCAGLDSGLSGEVGWTRGLPWGMEVVVPAGFNQGLLGRGKGQSAEAWAGMGVRSADGVRWRAGRSSRAGTGAGAYSC